MKSLLITPKHCLFLFIVMGSLIACDKSSEDKLSENEYGQLLKGNTKLKSPLLSYCSGNGQCAPVIDIDATPPGATTPGVTISWTYPSGGDHHFTLKCSGLTTYTTTLTNSGSVFFNTNLNEYKLSYQLSCSSLSTCANLRDRELS
jgi:hypothetical protein